MNRQKQPAGHSPASSEPVVKTPPKKVRLYDLQSGWMKWKKDAKPPTGYSVRKFRSLVARDRLFIVVGPKGVVVSHDFEGVHSVLPSIEEKISIALWTPGTERRIAIFPVLEGEEKVSAVIEDCSYTEHDVGGMVRIFGHRLDTNFGILLKSLREIGIDLSEYDTDREARRALRDGGA